MVNKMRHPCPVTCNAAAKPKMDFQTLPKGEVVSGVGGWTCCVLWEGTGLVQLLTAPPFLGTEGTRGELFPRLWPSLAVWWECVFKLRSFIPCSPGTRAAPSSWSSADSVSLGNQQKTVQTRVDFAGTHKSALPAPGRRAGCGRQPAGHREVRRSGTLGTWDPDLGAGRPQRTLVSAGDGGLRACEASWWDGQLGQRCVWCASKSGSSPSRVQWRHGRVLSAVLGGIVHHGNWQCYKPGPSLPLELISSS